MGDSSDEDRQCRCDNCSHICPQGDAIWPIPDIDERLDPGSEVPAGECPSCGALMYLMS